MKLNYEGCALCGSTWGNVWAEVDGQRMFFCCDVCESEFRGLIGRIKQDTGWDRIDELVVAGDRQGRTCLAISGGRKARFAFAFNSEGSLRRFAREDSVSGATPAPS